jgi:putative radical SAM enzyme (TIGR03279 family)
MNPHRGIRMNAVDPGSPADQMGLAAGDRCLELNGRPVSDFLDFQFHLREGETNTMLVRKFDGDLWEAEFELDEGEGLGIEWAPIRPRICRNKCIFCFVDQLPVSVRPSLRIKDEDYRHSFLHGNFITLGNLTPADLDRILEQRLSPLYVSVHSTRPDLRRQMVGCRGTDRFFEYFHALVEGGIRLHTQVVLCPGVNDGAELDRTLDDLARLRPAVQSIGIVPVGLSRHRRGLPALTPPTPEFCRGVIAQVAPRQKRWARRLGIRLAYLADEFYLQAGEPLPPAAAYDGFPQLENGIGMVRDFLEEFEPLLAAPAADIAIREASFATGVLFAPVLRACLGRLNRRHGTRYRVLTVRNRFLGHRVTVAGLLSGQDLVKQVAGRVAGEWLGVPRECLSAAHGVFLDNLAPEDLAAGIGRPVCCLDRGPAGFWEAVCGRSPVAAPPGRKST